MSRDVLEENLQRLLVRAYVPVRPSPEFRASLRLAVKRAASTDAAERAPATPARRILAAAALVLAIGAAVFLALRGRDGAHGPDELVARGRCAWRHGDEAWRALDDAETARGVEHAGGRAELATPPALATKLWFGSDGSAALAGGTRFRADWDVAARALDAELVRGALVLERLGGGGAWSVATAQGRFELVRGVLALSETGPELAGGARSFSARLLSGEARFVGADGPRALVAGEPIVARNGALIAASGPAGSSEGARVPARPDAPVDAPSATPPSHAATPADAGAITLALELPVGGSAHGGGVATLLPKPRLPEVGMPIARELAAGAKEASWDALPAGAYELFVDVRGYGVWRASDVALGAHERLSVVARLGRGAAVRGRVVDASTGAPLEHAQIVSETDAPAAVLPFDLAELESGSARGWRAFAETGPDGRFVLDALSTGEHVLRAWAPSRGAQWSGTLAIDPERDPVELVFRLAPGGALAARWLDATGRPRAGRRVIVSRIDFGAPRRCISYVLRTTNEDGRFEARDLAPGPYAVLSLEDDAVSPSMQQVVVRAGATTEVALGSRERGADLHGVLLRADGAPAAGVDVSIQRAGDHGADRLQNERTDAEGRFLLRGLAPGKHELYAGLEFGARIAFVSALDVPEVNDFTATFRLPSGTVRGRVTAAATREPLTNATLVFQREREGAFEFGARATTDARGAFSADFLPAGKWRATVYAPVETLASARIASFELAEGGVRDLDVRLEPGASATVVVRDASGAAVPGAQVAFVDADGAELQVARESVTDARGTLRAPGLSAGAWTVRVFREGSAPVEARIDLDAGEDRELPFTLPSAGSPR